MNKINHPSKYIKSKYKVALLGPYACGKSALLARVALGAFEQNYHMTLRTRHINQDPAATTKSSDSRTPFWSVWNLSTLSAVVFTVRKYMPLCGILTHSFCFTTSPSTPYLIQRAELLQIGGHDCRAQETVAQGYTTGIGRHALRPAPPVRYH
jgi:GTPase SAR1 family protein